MNFSTSFVKDKEPVLSIDSNFYKIICPKVIKFNNECYRMYFSQEEKLKDHSKNYTSIGSAVSKDSDNWLVEKGYRINFLSDNRFRRILSPTVIKINKDLYRMYFEARTFDNRGVIKSAVSNDGFIWNEDPGVRIGKFDNISYGSPFCLNETNSQFELFFERRSKTTRDIWVAESLDGIFFDEKKITPIIKQEMTWESYAIYSPDISYLNNCYHMYYAGWGGDPVSGHILYAYSYDKRNWKKYKIPVSSPGGIYDQHHCSEPSFIKISNKLKIFYEGCEDNKSWRILCAQKNQ